METEQNTPSLRSNIDDAQLRKLQLEIKNLKVTNIKLRLEVEDLKGKINLGGRIAPYTSIITALIAVAGLLWGIYQFHVQAMERQQAADIQIKRDNDIREKEFKKRFWEKQLELYVEASNKAAQLATIEDENDKKKAYQRFLELYHGDLVLVEDQKVKDAMKEFVELYIDYQRDKGLHESLLTSSRALARTCRQSLAETWDIQLQDLDFTKF